jgi:transcriptional regulator of arginine metabolism
MSQSLGMLKNLQQLLVEGSASTQEYIKQHLAQLGFEVNQAKISRLLRKLGAIKISNEHGQTVYSLPKETTLPSTDTLLTNLVTDIVCNESLIVVHTSPGSASLFGRLVDHHRHRLGILGTVAGDDTLFIAPQSTANIQETLARIKQLFI